jgi:hypothetical protein
MSLTIIPSLPPSLNHHQSTQYSHCLSSPYRYIFYLTVVVGVYYTLSQQDASSIIQAAVAISFINEIDNLLYEAISTREIKDVMSSCVYEIPMVSLRSHSQESFLHFALRQHQLLMQVPVLVVVTCSIVYMLRREHCDELGHGVW